jgi:fructokinase
MYTFACFGEVLWDVFPDHEKIGGAPLNVALRLNSFGDEKVAMISAVGNDDLGEQLIDYLNGNQLTTEYIQVHNEYQTGKVNVTLDSKGSASYEIKYPVSWDYIKLNDEIITLAEQSKVFIYGSLICRNSVSKQTLHKLLDYANFKVFDVNLRAPFYSIELLSVLMAKANFVKFNDEELELIAKNLNSGHTSIEENVKFIAQKFDVSHICVTRGGEGAVLYIDEIFYYNSGYPVKVKDTVGAGDSFLASLVYKITTKSHPKDALNFACAVGALVAASEGANPKLLESDIIKMIS